jgi:hypothetical protein
MAQKPFAFDAHPADPHVGFELGWDHAHHGVLPPPEQLHAGNPLFQGWRAGQDCFGARTLGASRLARQWLQLRLHAWQRGRAFELDQVTPHYLGQLDVPLCPVTRQPLGAADASIDRVCDQAGYGAGNLAMMSRAANRAKGGCRWDEALVYAEQAKAAPDGMHAGLDCATWARVAVLVSFVTPLPHAQAAKLPLLLQPPNRLRLLNPVQGLQALVTRELGRADGTLRLRALTAVLPGAAQRTDFHRFLSALLPRLISARQSGEGFALRHALEDAWRDERVNRCWQRFALPLNEALIDKLLRQCAALAGTRTLLHERSAATEGWALQRAGRASTPAEAEQRHRAWQWAQGAQARAGRGTIGASRSRTPDGHLPA